MTDSPTSPRRRSQGSGRTGLLAYPPPYRCWLALCSDPDNTTIEAWNELHATIWEDLALPFADSAFVENRNDILPDQVCLAEHPEILSKHPHDTIHTWGDFTMSRTHGFTRADAEACLAVLERAGWTPRVWTDHSNFVGNLCHRAAASQEPRITDASGHTYENLVYSLDLVRKAGVRYVWDGEIESAIWGQDRAVGRDEWYAQRAGAAWKRRLLSRLHGLLSPVAEYLNPAVFSYVPQGNRQYTRHTFADGHSVYLFRRFGRWELADIDGLGELIRPQAIDRFIGLGGTAVIYTHLGKRNARRGGGRHIPDQTRVALAHLARRYREGKVNLSPTSALLDYLVLRDHAEVGDGRIDFRADGIRFDTLGPAELRGHAFGVIAAGGDVAVTCEGEAVAHRIEPMGGATYRLSFGAEGAGAGA